MNHPFADRFRLVQVVGGALAVLAAVVAVAGPLTDRGVLSLSVLFAALVGVGWATLERWGRTAVDPD